MRRLRMKWPVILPVWAVAVPVSVPARSASSVVRAESARRLVGSSQGRSGSARRRCAALQQNRPEQQDGQRSCLDGAPVRGRVALTFRAWHFAFASRIIATTRTLEASLGVLRTQLHETRRAALCLCLVCDEAETKADALSVALPCLARPR